MTSSGRCERLNLLELSPGLGISRSVSVNLSCFGMIGHDAENFCCDLLRLSIPAGGKGFTSPRQYRGNMVSIFGYVNASWTLKSTDCL